MTITVEQVELLSVTGQLDDPGLERLQRRLDELLDSGARLLLLPVEAAVPEDPSGLDEHDLTPAVLVGAVHVRPELVAETQSGASSTGPVSR